MKRPVAGIALAWLGGALFSLTASKIWLLIIGVIWLLLTILRPQMLRISRQYGMLIVCVVTLSAIYNIGYDQRNVTHVEGQLEDTVVTWQVTIASELNVDGDQASFIVRTERSERIQVYLRLHSQAEQQEIQQWRREDVITITGTLQRPQPARNFDAFEYAEYLYYQKIHWIMQVDGMAQVVLASASPPTYRYVLRWTDLIREKLADKIDTLYSPQTSGFMQSVLIGLRDDLPPEQFQQFALIGLTHIMAISGLHVAIFVTGCLATGKLMRLTKETNAYMTLGLIPCYIMLTGAAPSAVRAGCMAMIGLYAWQRGWLKDGLSVISIVGLLMLIANPYYVFHISFQLSYVVTLGLIVFVPKLYRLIPLRSAYIKGLLAVTTTATICSFPLSIYYFNQFSLLSWLANVLIVPVISVIIIPGGMLTLFVSLFSETFAYWPARVIEQINSQLFLLIEWMSGRQSMLLIWASPSILWIIVYYGLIMILILTFSLMRHHMKRLILLVTCIGICMLLLIGYYPQMMVRDGMVQFIDVGQGDATLIRTPGGKVIVVDGGGTMTYMKPGEEWRARKDPYEVGKDRLVPLLKKRGIHHIDYLIVTHADLDHYGGLQAVIDHIPVHAFIFNGTLKSDERYEALLHHVLARKIAIYQASAGKAIQIDNDTELNFLHPQRAPLLHHAPKQNDLSLVTLLDMADYRFLFTGDIELRAEREMIWRANEEVPPPIDVMQVAHHGSRTSTSDQWLTHWQPRIAVIPVGRNNWYGHPHPHIVERLAAHEIAIYRTDQHGEIQFRISKGQLEIRTKLDIH